MMAAQTAFAEEYPQDEGHAQVKKRLISLRRMTSQAVAEVAAPGQVRGCAVAAAVTKATPAAHDEGAGQGQSKRVAGLDRNRHPPFAQLDQEVSAHKASGDRLAVG